MQCIYALVAALVLNARGLINETSSIPGYLYNNKLPHPKLISPLKYTMNKTKRLTVI